MQVKTDNDYLADKVALRMRYAPWPAEGSPLRLLDAYGGTGVVWRVVRRLTGREIARSWIDQRTDVTDWHLHGDNRKILPALWLDDFDCIDLDAYGIPYEQIRIIHARGWRGIVFATVIQTGMGRLPVEMLRDIGFSRQMIETCPTLCARGGWAHVARWLASLGVREVAARIHSRKRYIAFPLNGAELRATDWDSLAADKAADPA